MSAVLQSDSSTSASTLPFRVTLNKCKTATLTTSTPANVVYDLTTGPAYTSFTAWTDSYGTCGEIKYTASMSSSSSKGGLPSWVTFNPLSMKFAIQSSSIPDVGTYNI